VSNTDPIWQQILNIWEQGPAATPLPQSDQARIRAHVEELCREYGITCNEAAINPLDAEGLIAVDNPEITVPHLTTEIAYFVAMHEIGHHVLQLPSFDDECNRLWTHEADVWEWALAASILTPSEDACDKIRMFMAASEPGPGWPEARARVIAACSERRK
jgi:hypothetical protein